MKRWKKLLAVTLMVAMVCGVFAVIEPEKAEAAMPTTVYFNETFDTEGTFDNATWKSNSNTNLGKWKEYVSDGKMTVVETSSTVYLTADDDIISDKSDYTVSCEVQYDTKPTTQANVGLVARISAESNATMTNTGYEFQLTIPAEDDESPYVRIRDRADNGGYYTGIVRLDDLEYVQEPVLMEIECRGSNIICSVNNEVVLTYTISETGRYAGYNPETDGEQYTHVYNVGPAGIRFARSAANAENGIGANVSVDNFKVHYVADHKFSDDFNGYGSYESGSVNRLALGENGWYVANNRNANLLTGSAYVIPSSNTSSPIVLQTEGAKGALGWNDYSVEADITIGENEEDVPKGEVYACVTGRHTKTGGNDGYEIQLYDDGAGIQQIRICRRNSDTTPVELKSCDFNIVYGKTYNLKAVFQDDTIYAYVDNELFLEYTDTESNHPIGFAGIRKMGAAAGVNVTFDNFVVYDYDEQPATFVEDFESYIGNTTGAGNKNAMQANGWNLLSSNTLGNYNTGTSYKLPKKPSVVKTGWNLALTNLDEATEWQNCIVECEVTFNSDSANAASGQYTYVVISGRETEEAKTGYGIQLGATYQGALRYIRICKDGSYIRDVEGTAIDIATNRPKAGTKLDVKLVLDGRTVKGYVAGYEVSYTIPDDEEISSGHAGMHVTYQDTTNGGVDITFDNFKVYDLDNPYVKEIVGDIDDSKVVDATDTGVLRDSLLAETLDNEALDANKNDVINIYDYVRMMRLLDSMN